MSAGESLPTLARVAVCWKRDVDLGPARAFSSVVEEAEQVGSPAIGQAGRRFRVSNPTLGRDPSGPCLRAAGTQVLFTRSTRNARASLAVCHAANPQSRTSRAARHVRRGDLRCYEGVDPGSKERA